MRISILTPDISSNAMARACPIAQVLSQTHDIEIIGFDHGNGFFDPYEDEFDPITFDVGRTPVKLFRNVVRAERAISGDICYAFRPMLGSLGIGLLHKRRTDTPVVLDVEDIVRFEQRPWYQKLYNSIIFSSSPTSGAYAELLKHWLDQVDHVTVTSEFLQQKYGGTILPYGPDANEFDPESVFPDDELVKDYGDTPIVVFIGTIRPHKGLDILASALSQTSHEARLVIAGYDPHNMIPELTDISNGRVDFRGSIPHNAVPEYLAAADLIAIPQRNTTYTQAQIPNKVFEAMAMGRPVVASDVSDLATILGDDSWLVEPEDPTALAAAIDEILTHPEEAENRGQRLRKRYLEHYSWDALADRLNRIFRDATGK
jgi:glycosyltransferase involved in cell wall biosynthesis